MSQMFFRLLQSTIIATLLFFVFIGAAYAQQAGVSITPATIEETLDPGVFKEYSVTIENLNDAEQTFYLFTRNISGVKDGGVPIFATEDEEVTGFELTEWMALSLDQVTLAPREKRDVSFTLSVPQNASPGSHFGGFFVSVEPPDIEGSGAAVGYQVANIISIRVAGEAVESAMIRQFSTAKFFHGSQNVDFSVRVENSGNVLVRPVGPLVISNMLGKQITILNFNDTQRAVFPGGVRDYVLSWEGDEVGFGRYEALLSAVYGDEGAKKTMSSTVTFWILPMHIILPALGVLATILLLAYVFVRMYIRRTLAHLSHGGRRIVRRRKQSGSSATLLFIVVMMTVTALFLIVLLALFA